MTEVLNAGPKAGARGRGPATDFVPYVSPGVSPPEITLRAIVIGVAIGVIYGAANAYLGLLAGQTVSASLPAAVIGMFLLASVFRSKNVLENNIVQTIGSSGESLAAGVIFTVPALFFLGQQPSLALIFALAGVGGVLGMLFMIPLRRYLIVREHGKLAFPEGVACAEILKAGEQGGSQFGLVMRGISVGAIYRFVVEMFQLWNREFTFTFSRLHQATLAGEGMPALLGVGMIIGPRIASLMFAGGFLSWMIILPLLHAYGHSGLNPLFADSVLAEMTPSQIWSRYLRYVGAGAVAVGGIMAVLRSAGLMTGAFAHIVGDLRRGRGDGASAIRTERDLSSRWLVLGSLAAIAFLWFLLGPGNWRALVGTGTAVILAFFFVAVAAYICGQVGSSASPVSAMTITALFAICLVFLAIGWTGPAGMVAAMTVGAVICIAICMAGDMAQDLKTGFLLGATPWRQQVMNVVGSFAAAATIGFVLYFLHTTKTIGSEELPAPQATLMSLIVQGLFGGSLPWTLVGIGAGIGVVSEILRIPTLPFAVGIYLPFSTSTAMFVGGIVAWLLGRPAAGAAGRNTPAARLERGVLISSGLVAGDAIIGLLTIGLIEIAGIQWGITPFLPGFAWEVWSLGVFLLLATWLYRTALASSPRSA